MQGQVSVYCRQQDTEEDFVKLGWNSDDEVEEVTEAGISDSGPRVQTT